MASSKRKSEYVSDEFIASEDDDSRPSKRSKAPVSFNSASKALIDSDGNKYWEISKSRRVTISEFKGKKMINIREYYEKNGESLPGKKGISMTLEQYSTFISVIPHIESLLKQQGVDVPRPDYSGIAPKAQAANSSQNGADEDEAKRANIEATSDEDEDD